MVNNKILYNYANALKNIAIEYDLIGDFENAFKFMNNIFCREPQFIKYLDSPFIEKEDKKNIIEQILKDNTNKYYIYFIKLLIDDDNIRYFNTIKDEYHHLMNKHLGILEGLLYLRYPIDTKTHEKIEKGLEEKLKNKVKLHEIFDNSIIGGLKIVVNDSVYDYSINKKIDSLKENLLRK